MPSGRNGGGLEGGQHGSRTPGHFGKLAFGFELFTPTTVLDGQAKSCGYSWPPELPFHEAQGLVSTLVSGIPVTHVDGYLPSVYWNDEYQDCTDISRWGHFDEQKVVPFLEFFLPKAIRMAINFGSLPS